MAYKGAIFLDKLRQYYQESGFSYDDLADRAGVSRKTIANWLNVGLSRRPEQNKVLRLAAALNLSKVKTMELLALADYLYPARTELESLVSKESNPQVKKVLWVWLTETLKQIFQAPLAPNHFIGRGEEIKWFEDQITKPGNKTLIVGLGGMGGVGKTMLATYLAHKFEVENKFSDGILWASFTPDTTPEVVLQKFLITFGVGRETPDVRQKSASLKQILLDKTILMVLDNVERSQQVEWIIPDDCPNVVVFLTTRNQEVFEVLREKDYRVEIHSLKTFTETEALALLGHRVEARVLHEEQALKETINLIGGLPLALSIVAGHLAKQPNLSVTAYNQRLQAEALERLFDSRDPQERNVFASFELSYRDLPPLWRRLFVALSAFEGLDFDLKAIEAVTGDGGALISEMDMADLCARSLVEAGPAEGRSLPPGQIRYHLHSLLKKFARSKLAHEPEFRESSNLIQRRAADHFNNFVQQNNHKDSYRDLDFEWGNIFGSLKWAYRKQHWSTLLIGVQELTRPSLGMIGFVDAWGYWRQARQLLDWAMEGINRPEGLLQKASMLTHLGNFAMRQADYDEARRYFEESQGILTSLSATANERETVLLQRAYLYRSLAGLLRITDPQASLGWLRQGLEELEGVDASRAEVETGYINLILAEILAGEGQLEAAREEAERGLKRLPPDPSSTRLHGLICLGNIFSYLGDHQESMILFQEGFEMAQALGDYGHLARLQESLGIEADLAGDFAHSVDYYEKALPLYQRLGDIERECGVRSNLGSVYTKMGADEQALAHFTSALELIDQKSPAEKNLTHPLIEQEAYVRINLARLHLDRGRLAEAEANLRRVEVICEQVNLPFVWPTVLSWQAELARLEGKTTTALHLVEQALQEAKMGHDLLGAGLAHRVKGNILSAQPDAAEPALAAYQISVDLLADQDRYEAAHSQLALARHYLTRGQKAKAKTLLAETLAIFEALAVTRDVRVTQALLDEV